MGEVEAAFRMLFRYGLPWVGLPVGVLVLLIGPPRVWSAVKRGWSWLFRRRQEPEEILAQVVTQQLDAIEALKKALAKAEKAEEAIQENIAQCDANVAQLTAESKGLSDSKDELGARAAAYKLNLEKTAAATFRQQLAEQRARVAENRKRLYQLELQHRQFEVGRSILLSQLAEAKTTEQQYKIANEFDPYSAIASWREAEGMVEQRTLSARAAEKVHADLSTPTDSANGQDAPKVNEEALLAEIASRLAQQEKAKGFSEEDNHKDARQTEHN